MPNGIYLIDKQQGDSSALAIAKLKHKLNIRKIGHAGTLDPMATGLLVCLTGQATKVMSYALDGKKVYSGKFKLGLTSDTDDITGTLTVAESFKGDTSQVILASKNFIGEIAQVPPQISAVKIDGKRAYKRARQGEEFEISARQVCVDSFEIAQVDDEYAFRITCSKGTYIRSIVRDLGVQLGSGAVLSALRREASLPFDISMAKQIEALETTDKLDWWAVFPQVQRLKLDEQALYKMLMGNKQSLQALELNISDNLLLFCDSSGNPRGLLVKQNGQFEFGINFTED